MANLFTMRPVGVVSKKLMGTRRMLDSSRSCRTREARTAPWAARRAEVSRNRARTKTSIGKDLMRREILESTALGHLVLEDRDRNLWPPRCFS